MHAKPVASMALDSVPQFDTRMGSPLTSVRRIPVPSTSTIGAPSPSSTNVPSGYRERLKSEMDKFPYWHDDGIDASSYLYDIMKDYNFVYYQNYDIPEYEPVNNMVGY